MIAALCFAGLVVTAAGPTCPAADANETAADCPWAAFARRLRVEADGGRNIAPLFEKLAPELITQLRADRPLPAWRELWSDAVNRDPSTGVEVVDPRILHVLGDAMGIATAGVEHSGTVHAGLQHTYGCLFSNVPTDEGFRRSRWVSGALEAALGLPRGLLGPLPREGTLFVNATYLFGRIALADDPAAQAVLAAHPGVPRALRELPFDGLGVRRLEERVVVPAVSGREIVLRTDVVTLPGAGDTHISLLVYSLFDPSDGRSRLVNGFPITDPGELFAAENLGEDTIVSSRFDGYIDGLTGVEQPLAGTRRVISSGDVSARP